MSTVAEKTTDPPFREGDGLPAAFRWVLSFPRSPLWLGAGVGLLYLIAGIAMVGVDFTAIRIWDHVIYALYFGWVPLALVVLVRGSGRDAVDLAPALSMGAAALRERTFAAGSRALPWSLPVARGIAGIDLLAMDGQSSLLALPYAALGFYAIREVIVCIAIFGVLAWAAGAAWSLSRHTQAHANPDLLSARPLAPLARCGTRMLLFWVLMISLSLPFTFFAVSLSADSLRYLGLMSLLLLVAAGVALAIPTWGARQALRSAKVAELDRVRQQIRAARHARDDARLPGLLAWETRIESASEWPLDASSLRRSGLYVLIPVLSWVGGALVERVVDVVVD